MRHIFMFFLHFLAWITFFPLLAITIPIHLVISK